MGKLNNHPEKERDAQWALEVLDSALFVTLCLADGDEPYCVPLNAVVMEGKLYFHCARGGRKIDFLEKNPRVYVSAVSVAQALEERRSMRYKSAGAYGRAELVPDESEEKVRALMALSMNFAPSNAGNKHCAEKPNGHVRVYRVTIEEIAGKASYIEE